MVDLIPINLENYQKIPENIRKCNFWELREDQLSADPFFDKEIWTLEVFMGWGSCFHAYVENDQIEAVVTFAPPSCFPRQEVMSAGPVSNDAILLSCVRFSDYYKYLKLDTSRKIEEELISATIKYAAQRGIRAIEAFGSTVETYGVKTCNCAKPCFTEDIILENVGFKMIKSDLQYPRYRIDIEEGLEWKQAVESALDKLLAEAEIKGPRKLMLV